MAHAQVSVGRFACVIMCAFGLSAAFAAPLTPAEIKEVCAKADDTAHCGRLVEEVQLKRLPGLAAREGATLKVTLYPAGNATFNDTETLYGSRTFSLWDYLDPINAVLLYTNDHDHVTFTLLQRATGRKVELPTEPSLSPDRQRLVTADFCAEHCTNELAVWRVSRDGIRKEYAWSPKSKWSDAGAAWTDAETLAIEYTPVASDKPARLTRRLSDSDWIRVSTP